MSRFLIITILIFTFSTLSAQFRFQSKFDVPLSINGVSLERAWEGGLNATQFQTMDLNNDQVADLVLYHRISRDITTYLLINGSYVRSPQYDQVFPEDTRSLLLLKDFDCDGKKDLFTTTTLGIKVYRNTSENGNISWSVAKNFLSFDSGANIQMAPSDIPGIEDVNGDGALDILTFRFGNANSIDLYLNTGTCGSLEFTRAERRWGNFEECGCNNFVFGEACPLGGVAKSDLGANEPESITHIGGKTILLFDADNDGDMDLISSDETCETLYYLENEGDPTTALMTAVESFPSAEPAGFPFFPGAFLEDVDQDGLKDLLIATNADENIGNQIELANHVKMYTNTGSSEIPEFTSSQPFLQDQMLDLGEHVYPSLVDIDGDTDQDLILGNKGTPENAGLSAKLVLFENTGNVVSPAFTLINDDFLGLSAEGYSFIKPQFIDMDKDGDQDLVYQATLSASNTNIYYQENLGNQNFAPALSLSINSSVNDNPHWYDIDNDGDPDLLLGKQFGSLSLFVNEGDLTFSPEQNGFAGLIDDFNRLNLNLAVADIDGNGIDDLLTIDLSGELRAYRGPINLDFLATNPLSAIYFINNNPSATAFGIQNAIATAELLGAGKPDMILGSLKGGLQFIENISENNGETDEVIVRVRPNPASNTLTLLTNVNGVLHIYDLMGKRVNTDFSIVPGQEQEIDVTDLPNGLYIFRVISEQNQTKSIKVIIE